MNKPDLHHHTLTVSDLRNIRLDLQTGDMVTVTSTGDIAPVTRGADAIVVAAGATGVGITTDGTIACTVGRYGFRGATGGTGGIAIDVLGSAPASPIPACWRAAPAARAPSAARAASAFT
jgi:hypothetical protein